MIGILIAVVLAALVYAICVALGLPGIVAVVAAILVLLSGIDETFAQTVHARSSYRAASASRPQARRRNV